MRFLIFAVFAVTVAFAAPAYAYLDPGAGSFALQMLLAGGLAVAASARVYWFRIKGFMLRLIGRDTAPPAVRD
jgi:hypothetical protein